MTSLELRRQRRSSMLAVPERIALSFARGGIEMRAKPNGTGGTSFRFEGYAATFNEPFEMWDMWGDPYTEVVRPGAFTRTLANKADVAFLIGHQDAGILMARTKSGTMTLAQDSRGLSALVPAMDGSREDVRALASAVERGDMDEMSCAFVTRQQEWSPDYEQRAMLEMDLHRGDVSAVVFGANPGTAGSAMTALPVESLTLRRPVSVRMPTQPYTAHPGEINECPQCHSVNDDTACFCDQCGTAMRPASAVSNMAGVEDMIQACKCGHWGSADAKYCGACGQELSGDQGAPSYWRAVKQGEERGAFQVDTTDGPDYNPQPHADAPGQLACPHGSCTGDACAGGSPGCNGGCPVTGGALNSPDARCCDQCGGSLYSEDGTIILGDSGVPEEIEGDAALALARSRADLELRRRRLALLGV